MCYGLDWVQGYVCKYGDVMVEVSEVRLRDVAIGYVCVYEIASEDRMSSVLST